jgi:nicotinate-nucleotide pyrophosphorylase (carboxylating)
VTIEVDTIDQVSEALDAGADSILLDNMNPEQLALAVRQIDGAALTEASGGITLESVRAAAESGVDLISVGALTHSAPALDVALDFDWTD